TRVGLRRRRTAGGRRAMSRLEDLSERYGEHHRAKRTREFVYAGEERVELFRDYVGGPGRRVLDLGCRYGALTRAYAKDNDVVGVDVDRGALAGAAPLGIGTRWADFDEPHVHFIAGRFVPIHGALFANDIVFAGRKPR